MNKLQHWLMDEPENLGAQCFLWNMIGSLMFALGTMVLTIVVNRIVGDYAGGDFAMALAVGQLMATVGYFETRVYQVTDTKESFSFRDYYNSKLLTDFVMIIVSLGYIVLKGYDLNKSVLVILMCIYKMLDTFADVFEGDFQQKERLDIAGKSLTFRTLLSVLSLVIVLALTHNLYVSCIVAIAVALIVIYFMNIKVADSFKQTKQTVDFHKVRMILSECAPLFVSTFMSTYILNSSRYAIEANLASNFHSKYTAIFLPVSTINLCVGFIFKPMLTTMARRWNKQRYREFNKTLVTLFAGIALLTILVVFVAYFLGIPVLSLLYNTDLQEFRMPLLILLVGGGINSANVIVYYVLSVMRKQKKIFLAYSVTFIASLILPNYLVKNYQVMGAACSFTLIMAILLIISFSIFVYYYINERRIHKSQ